MFCEECQKKDEEHKLKRVRSWKPSRGYDPMMRKYLCTNPTCMAEVYLVRGRRFMVEPSGVVGADSPPATTPKPVRPKKTPPSKPEPVKLPEPAPAGVS